MTALPTPMLALVGLAVLAVLIWRPYLSVGLIAVATPVSLTQLPGGLDVITALSILVVGLGLWEHLLRRRSLLPQSWAAIGASVWTLGILGSVAFSSEIVRAATLGVWQIIAAWLAVAVAGLIRTAAKLRVALVATLIGATVVASTGLTGGFQQSGAFDASIVDNRAMGVFSQPNEYGLYCAMVWAFSLGIACICRGYLRLLAGVCSILSLAGLAASFSRGSWVGAVAAALVMTVFIPQTRRPQAITLTAFVSALSLSLVFVPYWPLPSLLLGRFSSIFSGESNPYDNRPALFAEGMRQWAERPVLGVGPNMYPVEASTLASETRTIEGQHAHNLIVTMGAEQGLVGLIALSLIGVGVYLAIAASRRVAKAFARAGNKYVPLGAAVTLSAMGAVVAMLAAGVVDYPLRNPLTRATLWLVIGLLLAGKRCLDDQEPLPPASSKHLVEGEQSSTSKAGLGSLS